MRSVILKYGGVIAALPQSSRPCGSEMTKPEWIRLPEAEHRLQERFRGLLNTVMVERSVLSGEVPIRAINYASPIHIPIEKQIRPNMKVDVFLSQIQERVWKSALVGSGDSLAQMRRLL